MEEIRKQILLDKLRTDLRIEERVRAKLSQCLSNIELANKNCNNLHLQIVEELYVLQEKISTGKIEAIENFIKKINNGEFEEEK